MNEQPTSSDMLTFLRERYGSQAQLQRAVAHHRASRLMGGQGLPTIMAAVAELYKQERCEHEWSRRRDGRRCHKCERVEFGFSP